MIDNGILSSSANCIDKDGTLCLVKKKWEDFKGDFRNKYSVRDRKTGQKYFVKKCTPKEQTAEVLLSQIYARHGFTTAIALPATGNRIISNDVAGKPNAELVYDFFVRKALRERGKFSPDAIARIIDDSCDVHDLRSASIPRWEELFTPEALTDRFRWDAFTIASGNSDDHLGNAVVYVNKHGLGEEIAHYDFGEAGVAPQDFLDKQYYAFYNGKIKTDRETFLRDLAQNKRITKYINPKDLANEIGAVNVLGVAQDINQSIGFNLEQSVVDNIALSYEMTAEDLLNYSK